MTTRPRTSYMVHSGFNDLINLISATPSRLGAMPNGVNNGDPKRNSRFSPNRDSGLPRKSYELPVAGGGYTDEELSKPPVPPKKGDRKESPKGLQSPRSPQSSKPPTPPAKEPPQSKELKKRKVDKREIGYPTDFRHIFHASTYEEATELLLRWSAEGLSDKIGDPAWANPIKQVVKTRALEQQARAVADVVEATARTRELGSAAHDLYAPRSLSSSQHPLTYHSAPPGTLRVINGLPSSIYSSLNSNPLLNNPTPSSLDTAHVKPESTTTTISPSLARASTPRMIANMAGYFEYESSRSSPGSALGLQPGTSPESPMKFTNKKSLPLNMAPTLEPMAEHPDASDLPPGLLLPPSSSKKRDQRPSAQDLFTPLPFRVIKPTLPTLEKAMSVALFFEGYYHPFLSSEDGLNPYDLSSPGSHDKLLSSPIHPSNYPLLRARRQAALETTLLSPANRFMSPAQQDLVRAELQAEERRWLRERRRKVDVRAFEMGRVIGHGAFGVVRIAREREGGRLVAMKQLRKADMLQKSQEGHVKAEKDLLASASSSRPPLPNLPASSAPAPSRIVQLFYAFQDTDHLYLVLEYMGGGDLLNLLVERDTFSEEMTRVYVAEMVLALEETHGLGYVHRDIKPDNFLFDQEGHIKISDFGLATDLHWAHDTSYYDQQRLALLKKHGVDLEYPSVHTKRMDRKDVKRILGKEWVEKGEGVLEWRERNRRKLAYSVCGTNSYMAPEVIRGQGYGFSCDWWSLGIIMYECLYGYPPFTSSSRHITRQKILNWPQTLKFPPAPKFSPACLDLITQLLCEPEDRLGSSSSSSSSPMPLSGASSPHSGEGRPRGKRVLSAGSGLGLGKDEEKGGLGKDGVEEIKRHAWFRGIDWDNLHRKKPPYSPDLYTDDDTRHFDEDIPGEPLAPPGTAQDSKDPLLRNKTHGAHLLEIRKQLAFKGWTFKSPHLDTPSGLTKTKETRYGHLDWVARGGGAGVEHLQDASDETVMAKDHACAFVEEDDDGELRGTVKARAMSY
ncbi:hypothetical protein I350_01044 [Cryptococcus amylolentus CBS 6273]|uniref:non-specific serine/threonine protein kinase n=1 Tax=Cryptococcus amylolentus CBS 6273 TaxID=1296118 RepID=A0A1E3KBG2_9TREE|nr:hypothetical protein I350_01044 [Cryptococcus amylolentus CBS 6273]